MRAGVLCMAENETDDVKAWSQVMVNIWRYRWALLVIFSLISGGFNARSFIASMNAQGAATASQTKTETIETTVTELKAEVQSTKIEINTLKTVLLNQINFLARKMAKQRTVMEQRDYQDQIEYIQSTIVPKEGTAERRLPKGNE